MRWVRRIEPLVLSQESDIPYVIQSDGVLLCFDNMYREGSQEVKGEDSIITFKTNHKKVMRQSTNFHRFHAFPTLIPFEDIVRLNDTVIDGRLLKTASEVSSDPQNIAVIKERFIDKLGDSDFQEFAEEIEEFDHVFILVGDEIGTNTRLLCDSSHPIHHMDWGRTCVTIADAVCMSRQRKYCWTKNVPQLEITTYGLKPDKDLEKIYQIFLDIGVETITTWGG